MASRLVMVCMAGVLLVGGLCVIGFKNQGSGDMKTLSVTSDSFENNQRLPDAYTCVGQNISPHIAWDDVPEATKSIALICDDPDAPDQTWVHWVVYNMPPVVRELAQNTPSEKTLSNGGQQGVNDFGKFGYGGACPPQGHGTHHYHFKVYALDAVLDVPEGATKGQLEEQMDGHILAHGQIVGTYSR